MQDKSRPIPFLWYALVIAVTWTLCVLASLVWDISSERTKTREVAVNEARASFNRDQAFRLWVASRGGVYVPADSRTPPNPYLSNIPERDIRTPSGRSLTLVNPAYFIRLVMTEYAGQYGTKGHLTSLDPIQSGNAPDEWERKALESFEEGTVEAVEFSEIDGMPYLRLMRPVLARPPCLKCHGAQGYTEGDIRGGIGVSVPLAPLLEIERRNIETLYLSHALIWVIGLLGIGCGTQKIGRNATRSARAEEELRKQRNLLRTILSSTQDMIFLKDTGSVFQAANPAFCEYLGKTEEEIIGKTNHDLFPEPYAGQYTRDDRRVMETGVPLLQDEEGSAPGAENRWFQVLKNPVLDSGGRTVGIICALRDITDRKRDEETIAVRARQQAAVSELGLEALAGADAGALMDMAVTLMKDGLDVENSKVLELLPGGEELLLKAGKGWREGLVARATVSAGIESQAGYTLLSDGPVIVEDMGTETRFNGPELLLSHGVVSGMSVIISGPEGPYGVLGAHTARKRTFTGDDVNFLQSVANVLAGYIVRKSAEEKIRRSNEILENVFSSDTVLIAHMDRDFNFIRVNRRYAEADEQTPQFFVGKNHFALYPNEENEAIFRRVVETGEPHSVYARPFVYARHPERGVTYWDWNLSPVKDAHGRVEALTLFLVNVTDRRRAEESLRDSEERYRTLVQAAPYGIQISDREGVITLSNPAHHRIHGAAPGELAGRHVWDFVEDPEGREALKEYYKVLVEEGPEPSAFHTRNMTLDGREIDVRVNWDYIRDAGGGVEKIVSIISDVTAEKEFEERLQRWADIFQHAEWGIVVGSADGRTLEMMNPAFARMHGYTVEELTGRPIIDVFAPEFREKVPGYIKTAHEKGHHSFESMHIRRDGTTFPVFIDITAVKDDNGEVLRRVVNVQDITEIKRAEEEIRKFKTISDNSNSGLAIADPNGTLTYVNEYFAGVHGFTPEELIGKHMGILHSTEQRPAVNTLLRKLHEKGSFDSQEVWHRKKDGSTFPMLMNGILIRDKEGGPQFIAGSAVDITELVQTGEELRRSRDLLASITQIQSGFIGAPDFSILFEGLLEDVLSLTGSEFGFIGEVFYTDEGKPYLKTHALSNIAWNEETRALYEEHAAGGLEFYNLDTLFGEAMKTCRPVISNEPSTDPRRGGLPKGHPLLHSFLGIPFLRGSKLVGMVGMANRPGGYDMNLVEYLAPFLNTCTSIIEAYRSEQKRREAEAFISSILESVGEAFIVIDPEYRIISANRAFCAQTRLSLEDILGRSCHEVTHNIDRPCHEAGEECPVRNTFLTGEPQRKVHVHHDSEGNPVYVEIKSYPMRDHAGNVTSAIEIIADITERRMLEEQLRQSQKMEAIGTLTGGIAHDFNNILTAILGYGEFLQAEVDRDPRLKSFVDMILAAGERGAKLTKSLLAFSRKQIIHPEPVDLNGIIRNVENLLSRLIREDIVLRTELSDWPLTIMADSVQIEQILINLATNASDAMPHGGRLFISTAHEMLDVEYTEAHEEGKPGSYALVSITDTGTGMDEATRQQIFEPFFTTKEVGKGTGLGLSVVYGIVKQHNGFVHVYSEPGEGTTMKIYLPLVKAEGDKEASKAASALLGGTETVLVAEDDADVRRIVKTSLERYGYTVLEAEDGEAAVQLYKRNREQIQLLLFDMIMPGKSGLEAYEEIRNADPHIKVLFLSGYPADILREKEGKASGLHVVSKPISPTEILRKVREAIDREPNP